MIAAIRGDGDRGGPIVATAWLAGSTDPLPPETEAVIVKLSMAKVAAITWSAVMLLII